MNEPHQPASGSRFHPILLLIGGIVVVYVTLGVSMLFISMDVAPQLVRQDYYEYSKQVDADLRARHDARLTGWQVVVLPPAEQGGTLRLHAMDAQGAPLTGLAGEARAFRPSAQALDQKLDMTPDPERPGGYLLRFGQHAPGAWRIDVDLRGSGLRYIDSFRVNMP